VAMTAAVVAADVPMRMVDGEAHAITPVGLVPLRCLTELPVNGAHIRKVDPKTGDLRIDIPNRKPMFVPPCKNWTLGKTHPPPPSPNTTWLAYTSFNVSSFDSFLGYISVPPAPSIPPVVLYAFTALQNVNWIPLGGPPPNDYTLILPSLEYQPNAWSLRVWMITQHSVVYSGVVSGSFGDNIFGNMTQISGGTWDLTVSGSSGKLSYQINGIPPLKWSYATFSCYGCDLCSSEPPQPVQFTKLVLTNSSGPVTANWKAFQSPHPVCNARAKIQSPSAVTFEFGNEYPQ